MEAGLIGRDHYGESVIEQLAEDLEINAQTIRRAVVFRRVYDDKNLSRSVKFLTWSHYRLLIEIRDDDARLDVYKRQALTNLYSDRIKTNANIEKLKPELKSKSETTQKELSVFNAIYGSLQTLQSQLEADNGSLIIAQNDLETLITYLANDCLLYTSRCV